jgi:hypothetical protein
MKIDFLLITSVRTSNPALEQGQRSRVFFSLDVLLDMG